MNKAFLWAAAIGLVGCAHAKQVKEFDADENWEPPQRPAESQAEANARIRLAELATEAAVYFDYDRAELTDAETEKLRALAGALEAVPKAQLVIQGNCDERGTEEYNLVLGQRRADMAKWYLSLLGVADERLAA